MKTTVIYHRADFDGLFCREIARKFLGNGDVEYVGWDYGDAAPVVPDDHRIYMLDISVDGLMAHRGLIWIDHHKTAMEKYAVSEVLSGGIPGYRIDGVAACRLAWQWFQNFEKWEGEQEGPTLPPKEEYVARTLVEPVAVRLAGEYDIWDKRDPAAELFQHGLRSQPLDDLWHDLLSFTEVSDTIVRSLLDSGRAIQYARTRENEGIIKAFGFTIQFEGFCLLACNAARYNSQLFAAGLKPEHDGCLGFNWDGQSKIWRVSLYTDKSGIDLSPVAVKYGGGGHSGACGFRIDKLPFLP